MHFKNRFFFFLSLAFFAFQIVMAPTLSCFFGGRYLILVLSPPLLASALTIYYFDSLPRFLKNWTGSHWALACAGSILASIAWLPSQSLLPTILVLCLPYCVYSACLAQLMKQSSLATNSSILFLEFAGALIGIIASVLSLEIFGWTVSIGIIFLSFILALLQNRDWRIVQLGAVLVFFLSAINLQPKIDPKIALRGAASAAEIGSVKELAQKWNSYSKVQAISYINEMTGKESRVIVLGEGAGTAALSYETANPPTTVSLTAPLQPKKILILFAGAGVELFGFKDQIPNFEKIVGVEINSALVKVALNDTDLGLKTLLEDERVKLHIAESRNFLERTKEKFDLILFSWSGATNAFYSGVSLHTAKYSLTQEAFRRAKSRLNPEGVIAIFGVAKANVLAAFREISKEGPLSYWLLESQKYPKWRNNIDAHALLIKNGEWTPEQIARVSEAALKIQYRPLLPVNSVEQALAQIDSPSRGTIATDDKPFPYAFGSNNHGVDLQHYAWSVAAILLVVYLSLQYKTWKKNKKIKPMIRYKMVVLLGFSSMALQMYLTYKAMLYIGQPTTSLCVSLLVSIAAMAAALLAMQRYSFSPRKIGLLFILSILIWTVPVLFSDTTLYLFEITDSSKILLFASFGFTATFLGAFLFPSILRNSPSANQAHHLLGLDCLAGAFAVATAPLFIETWGLNMFLGFSLFLAASSCVCYFYLEVSGVTKE